MTVRFYTSSDVGAPVLRGATPGDLINLLEKCLVTGYGSKAGAGWTKPYTGTNIAAFRQGAGSNNMYLRVDDSQSAASGWRSSRVVGYESMSDVNTGSPISFPTPDMVAGGYHWITNYSGSTVANARSWQLLADESLFYLFIRNYPESSTISYYNEVYFFGDMIPLKPGDVTHTIISGKLAVTNGNQSDHAPFQNCNINQNMTLNGQRLAVARSFSQIGGPIELGWHADSVKGSSTYFGNGSLSYPHAPDGALYLAPVWVHEPQISPYNVRGIMPGMWVPCHNNGILSQGQIFDGQGDLLGKQFWNRNHYLSNACFEISDTWDR